MKFIVDTNLTQSMGKTINHPQCGDNPSMCRNIIKGIVKYRHTLLYCKGLYYEYTNHANELFWEAWVIQASRRNTESIAYHLNMDLIKNIVLFYNNQNISPEEKTGILKNIFKDIHIIELSIISGAVIISNDLKIKRHLINLYETNPVLFDQIGYIKWSEANIAIYEKITNPSFEWESPDLLLKNQLHNSE